MKVNTDSAMNSRVVECVELLDGGRVASSILNERDPRNAAQVHSGAGHSFRPIPERRSACEFGHRQYCKAVRTPAIAANFVFHGRAGGEGKPGKPHTYKVAIRKDDTPIELSLGVPDSFRWRARGMCCKSGAGFC